MNRLYPYSAKQNLLLSIICLCGCALSLLINYPGFMSYDSVLQILEARDNVYSDWHPPFMAFVWHYLDKIIPGPAGMLIFETALIWAGTFLIALFWFRGKSPLWYAGLSCLLVFYPPIFGISGAIWKDIFMWAFLALAIGLAGAIEPFSRRTSKRATIKIILGSLFLCAALLYRYNALFAIIPLIALGIVRSLGASPTAKQIALAGAIGIFILTVDLGGAVLINKALTTYQTIPWKQVAVYDVAGTIYEMKNSEEQRTTYARIPASIRGNGTVENLLSTYSTEEWNTLQTPEHPAFKDASEPGSIRIKQTDISPGDQKIMKNLWLETIFNHPREWLTHKTNIFKRLIGANHEELLTPVFMNSYGYPDWVAKKYWPRAELTRTQTSVNRILTYLSWHFDFRPWLYMLLGLFVMGACIALRPPQWVQIGLIAASGWAHEMGLFFMRPRR